MDKSTVCAIVVTYNRKELLLECLDALLRQTRPLQGIYLIDNASTDGTPELLLEKGYITELPPKELNEPWEKEFAIQNLTDGGIIRFHYVRMHENTGGAGGFYEGVKRGYEKGYDWLWLMDDDAEPKEDALEQLTTYFQSNNISALAGIILDKKGVISHPHRGYFNFKNVFSGIVKKFDENELNKEFIEIDHASFVGIIVNCKAVSQIGYPKREFFIHFDDVEYCIRLRKAGKILLIPRSVIIHKEAAKNKRRIEYNQLWIRYYGIRNLVWLGKTYSTNKIIFYIGLTKKLIRSIGGVIIYGSDHWYKRIKFVFNAFIDGIKGNFDNDKPKRILYG